MVLTLTTTHVKIFTDLRKKHRALRRGKQLEMWQDDQVYGFTRLTDVANEEVIAFFNNSSQPQTRQVSMRAESPLKNGGQFVNVFDSNNQVSVQNGKVNITIPPLDFVIYRAR